MAWTTQKPTREGWYWYRSELDREPKVVAVYYSHLDDCWVASSNGYGETSARLFVEYDEGEWDGPISPPERIETCKTCKHWQGHKINIYLTNTTTPYFVAAPPDHTDLMGDKLIRSESIPMGCCLSLSDDGICEDFDYEYAEQYFDLNSNTGEFTLTNIVDICREVDYIDKSIYFGSHENFYCGRHEGK